MNVVVEEDLDAVEGELLEAHRLPLLVAVDRWNPRLEQWVRGLWIVVVSPYMSQSFCNFVTW